ncbi:hypothetical protein ACFPMF_27970 [Larkinella bovis]|uniref:Uncharacterized protein n=1 Tax=Larkinella bovis TaxID=683041 RepID=A0ABW0IIA9_9BACT
MTKQRTSAQNLTDEEVLKEFVKRFQCDGAVLMYLDSDIELGFGRWCNTKGQNWVDNLFKRVKQQVQLPNTNDETEGGLVISLSA